MSENDAIAVIDDDKVYIMADNIEYVLTKSEYDYALAVLTHGIDIQYLSNVIRPCDIIGYLNETNPEAENVVVEEECSIAKRQGDRENMKFISIGFAALLVLIGAGFLYMMISDGGSSASTTASAAAGISFT